jgi:hydroxysqualene dehydroxylase
MARRCHIVGAGLAGLSAAVRLARSGETVVLYEAATVAGGRCRSHHDAAIGTIDNGNHLLLSGNHAALDYLETIGARDRLRGQARAAFRFVDIRTGERWQLDMGNGVLPFWLLDPARRVPETNVTDYLALARLVWCHRDKPIAAVFSCTGELYDRMLRPLLTAALNVDPPEASAILTAALLRESVAAGGRACRPLIVKTSLSDTFINPALAFLERHNAAIHFGRRFRSIEFTNDCASALVFSDSAVELTRDDIVVLAIPPAFASAAVPELTVPDEFRPIFNLHFKEARGGTLHAMTGVTGGLSEWVFAYPGRVSVTISNAGRLIDLPREDLAQTVWREVQRALDLDGPLPAWKIVRERQATFAATPAQQAKRPPAETAWRNLFLAGDWTGTGLPATIEGAIRSGNKAAGLALAA